MKSFTINMTLVSGEHEFQLRPAEVKAATADKAMRQAIKDQNHTDDKIEVYSIIRGTRICAYIDGGIYVIKAYVVKP